MGLLLVLLLLQLLRVVLDILVQRGFLVLCRLNRMRAEVPLLRFLCLIELLRLLLGRLLVYSVVQGNLYYLN